MRRTQKRCSSRDPERASSYFSGNRSKRARLRDAVVAAAVYYQSGRPSSATPTTAQFRVAIENAGESDAVLNMRLMMANGQALLPTALFLTITNSQKAGRELTFHVP